jgi:bacterioferritin
MEHKASHVDRGPGGVSGVAFLPRNARAPHTLTGRRATEYRQVESLLDMIKDNLVAERIAIEIYRDLIRFCGDGDPTTRRMLEEILAQEEEHANDMHDLLLAHDPSSNRH